MPAAASPVPRGRPAACAPQPRDFVVCYGRSVDLARIEAFDLAVLDPRVDLTDREIRSARTEILGYLSVGEVGPHHPDRDSLRRFKVTENTAWGSWVMDLSDPAWRRHLIHERLPEIRARGFRGLFLDTMDAVDALAAHDPERVRAYRDGLVELVEALRAAWPEARIIANRGFAVLDRILADIDGVLIESLFRSYDPTDASYVAVPEDETAKLVERLSSLRNAGLAVYALDYADDPILARQTVQRIRDAGFVPYVSTVDLEQVSTTTLVPEPRRVMILLGGERAVDSFGFHFVAMPLNWLGMAVDYVDANGELPGGPLANRYRGILLFFNRPRIAHLDTFVDWLEERRREGIRVLVLNHPGISAWDPSVRSQTAHSVERFWSLLGMRIGYSELAIQSDQALQLLTPGMMSFEAPLPTPAPYYTGIESIDPQNRVHFRVVDKTRDMPFDCVVTGPAGGLALEPYVHFDRPDGQVFWFLNVFEFLRTALALESVPAPDVTTLDGSRVFLSHIDGDGFVNRSSIPPHDAAGAVIRDEILERYRIPVTVSIVEGEVGPDGLWPARSREFEALARSIFRLPYVEAASHTYSHPFYWEDDARDSQGYGQRHMPIPGYTLDLEREVGGSVRYIQKLLPPGKRVEVLLWSGNCKPGETAIRLADEAGLENMNGGDTTMRARFDSYSAVAPLTVSWGSRLQILAPNQNDNVYTHDWTEPKWGFRNVVGTFEATESPRRVKPIDIYYHFYSGDNHQSLEALHHVYRWALSRDVAPRFAGEYARTVRDFRATHIDRLADGGWRVRNAGRCRTLRFDSTSSFEAPELHVDLERSRGVHGFIHHQGSLYVHLDGRGRADVYLTREVPRRPYIARSSHEPRNVAARDAGVAFSLGGLGPVRCKLAGFPTSARLELTINGQRSTARADARGSIELGLPAGRTSHVAARGCTDG
ncbi:MAG: endo alpha-1,4 polygalactosaminidase [Candidatus Krumholzibacteriia bacterium]